MLNESAGPFNPTAGRLGNHLSLFAGIGATDLAVEAVGWKTVATSEIDPWCSHLMQVRYPDAIHYGDVRTVGRDAGIPSDAPLLISGGFPCQGVAGPGTGAGLNDPRSGLWLEFHRIIDELQPAKVLIENSPMLRTRGLQRILIQLSSIGYDARWDCIPAASVGAPHLRDRIFIVAEPSTVGPCLSSVPIPSRAGRVKNGVYKELTPLATIKESKRMSVAPRMYPTPTLSDGTGGPGTTPKRTGGKNLRTVVDELEGNGRLNPEFVEWMMGLPLRWTDASVPNSELSSHPGWLDDVLPRTSQLRIPERSARIKALGNALVPQAALVALTSYRN